MADAQVYINDKDLSDLGFILETPEGFREGLTFPDRRTGLPGRVGTVRLAREDESSPRRIILVGTLFATPSEGVSTLRSHLDELKGRLYDGDIEVRFSDDEERVFYGRTENVGHTAIPPALTQRGMRLRVPILCSDPLIYARRSTVVPFAAAAAQLPLGTAPSTPLLRIGTAPGGAATNPTITYKDHRGDTITTLALTYTFGASEWLDIDCELAKITDESDANQISALTSGDFPVFDPHDASGESGPYPTIEISAATGAIDFAEAHYRKAWS